MYVKRERERKRSTSAHRSTSINRGRTYPSVSLDAIEASLLLVVSRSLWKANRRVFSCPILPLLKFEEEILDNYFPTSTITWTMMTDNPVSSSYNAGFQPMIDSYLSSVQHLSSGSKDHSITGLSLPLIEFNRDPAASEHLTDEMRWLLIQYGPHQPRADEEQFLASSKSTSSQKGVVRFRARWFDDARFSDWLEYSLTTSRAYCFYCRLFADSNRNRAFSRNGKRNFVAIHSCLFVSFVQELEIGVNVWDLVVRRNDEQR